MSSITQTKTGSQGFLAKVFGFMFLALAVSSITALLFANNHDLMATLISKTAEGKQSLSWMGWLVMLAPLGFVIIMSFGYQSLPKPVLTALFLIYAAITGISLSFILLAYTPGSIVSCFVSAAVMFGLMGIYGYKTKKDLTSMGSILFMCLIGLIVAMLINMLLHSGMMDYIISIVGVIVFCGLTAYDVQKLKEMEGDDKDSIMGALALYLDFLNLFLFLLRLFGVSSKD